MGKIFDSPEVVRVYTGSYWNGALINHDFESMFDKDEQLLVRELVDLPRYDTVSIIWLSLCEPFSLKEFLNTDVQPRGG
jgi:hypothetical protein